MRGSEIPPLLGEQTRRERVRRELDFRRRQALRAYHALVRRPFAPQPLVVFTTSRSGSTWFCDLLSGINQGGPLPEHLRPRHFEYAIRTAEREELLRAWLEAVAGRLRRGRDGGSKLIWDYFPDLFPSNDAAAPRRTLAPLLNLKPFCLRLRRRDSVAQAVSRYRSSLTGIYHHYRGERGRPSAPGSDPAVSAAFAFDAAAIAHHEGILRRAEADLDGVVARLGTPVQEVIYEELAADPSAVLAPIVASLRQDLGSEAQSRRLQQALARVRIIRAESAEQHEWVHRYRAENDT